MTQHFFIGVDGGATKCMVRVEDAAGNVLGEEKSGPANIRISVPQAWESIHTALNHILSSENITLQNKETHFHMGVGIAGCEVREAYQAFLNYLNHRSTFASLVVTSDAHTACLGAHSGSDGAIIIVGTGVVGYQINQEKKTKVSGWGFPQDDDGGGAWIGLQAVKLTLQWLDGRQPKSNLALEIDNHFEHNKERFMSWVNQANSTRFAELAPYVIQKSEEGDRAARHILEQAALAIDIIGATLANAQHTLQPLLPCALVGGLAPYIKPYLGSNLKTRLHPALMTPVQGAIFLVRQHVEKKGK